MINWHMVLESRASAYLPPVISSITVYISHRAPLEIDQFRRIPWDCHGLRQGCWLGLLGGHAVVSPTVTLRVHPRVSPQAVLDSPCHGYPDHMGPFLAVAHPFGPDGLLMVHFPWHSFHMRTMRQTKAAQSKMGHSHTAPDIRHNPINRIGRSCTRRATSEHTTSTTSSLQERLYRKGWAKIAYSLTGAKAFSTTTRWHATALFCSTYA